MANQAVSEAAKPTAQMYERTGKTKSKEDFVLKIIPYLPAASNLE